MPRITCECEDCRGTGLYSGFAESKGEAVVCLGCAGSGCVTKTYTEFTGRKKKSGITTVRLSRGAFAATGIGGHGQAMTYSQFEKKFPPG